MFIHFQVGQPASSEEYSSRKYPIISCYFILRGITSQDVAAAENNNCMDVPR